MAPIAGFSTIAKDVQLIECCETLLLEFATRMLQEESPWTGLSGQTTGYNKRVKLAKTIISTKAKIHASICATLIVIIEPNIVTDNNNTLDYLLLNNPSGVSVIQCRVRRQNGFSEVSYNSGLQIWDTLAGVDQSDIL